MNTKIRLYFSDKIESDLVAHLKKEQSHYLKDVMRLKSGDTFSIFNNQGEWKASVINYEKQAAKKLHARLNGQQLVGVDAFLEIWTRLPYYRLLAKLVKIQPITFFANIIYSLILAPSLYKLHQVRQKKKLNSYQ